MVYLLEMKNIVSLLRLFISAALILTFAVITPILRGICKAEEFADNPALYPEVQFSSDDRILILAPHPDDEVLGCAGIIQKALLKKLPVEVVFFTYGDNNEWSFLVYRRHPVIFPKSVQGMGLIRHDEAIEADMILGLSTEQLIFLGYPDFGTLNIWYKHWGKRPPFMSMLTKVKQVPYKNAFRPAALYKGEEILSDLKAILTKFKPTKIFLSHPADHNMDHRALYLFTNVALWDLSIENNVKLYPFLVHYKSWPLSTGGGRQGSLLPPELFKRKIPWEVSSLNKKEITQKNMALKKHHSQFESEASYLEAFIRKNELFGDYPKVKLEANAASVYSFPSRKEGFTQIKKELIDKERNLFVGIEEHSAVVRDRNLVLSLSLSRSLGKEVGVVVYLFGYRKDVPFAKMPKIRIRIGMLLHAVYDQNIKINLSDAGIRINRQNRNVVIVVPLRLLGNPERILTSANTYLGNLLLDWVSWRIMELAQP